jgi:hypothetical protein
MSRERDQLICYLVTASLILGDSAGTHGKHSIQKKTLRNNVSTWIIVGQKEENTE